MNRPYAKLTITKKGERAARSGHPWVYGEEVTHVEGTYQTGDIVDVYSDKDRYLGTGFANDISKIRVRIVSRNANDRFDEAFWQRRVKYALDYRKTVMGDKDFACCRLIFGDADDMPGLTVDRYNDVLVAQTLCYGMDQVKPVIFKALAGGMAYGTESRGGAKGSVTSHILRFRCGNTHFPERVPLPAIRAFSYPLGRVVAAVLTNVCYLILSH